MKIVLASGNKGKIKEFEKLMPNDEVVAFKEILGDIEIIEDKDSFKGNAIKKAQTIYDELEKKGYKDIIVISDDSGITVPALNNEPGIYSARYAGVNASDKDNNSKLIENLNKKNIEKTSAFYTACIAIIYQNEVYTVHGWMHGNVINKELGQDGFGYDPMFIANGFEKTLGELGYEAKKDFSHRTKALNLAKKVLDVIL
ncbi:non-canonical purine NTP pyrophosphatase [Poseidonibacter ostreae]|jgi:XTP/dITP diphosphohydrolase|uniref:dITP/XTP pyrophosphatase n=1 Tax=Poseidonibacter ostreae TaxID=2654171 RepID=A0A6L4WNW5_9BACT|nr:non-canonical purine NTP pyrophosphatase [Poseidonibacter ostreae]KAB7883160.1 non-canonical purine NTP pyrophosphatase [Poseidonibacter ostreae]KAB7885141.1 non-canonical purine NTP pyrophosphatase [Poseidonibacter ostreae]KAB7887617.1 non-canonical purine NTP pyrophosphatase [Poseidonibacter ostreae]MAC83317.1 non-canonical purine NTP pyrophosphatase [Arcobacter sp.]|tara:strand:- start:3610 stop:4209 length:600 start_codon:yes stop_codon:yes gene_type:complete